MGARVNVESDSVAYEQHDKVHQEGTKVPTRNSKNFCLNPADICASGSAIGAFQLRGNIPHCNDDEHENKKNRKIKKQPQSSVKYINSTHSISMTKTWTHLLVPSLLASLPIKMMGEY